VSRQVIAVIAWNAAAPLKENARLFEAACDGGKVRPREWRDDEKNYRSLTLWGDGSCELQRLSTAAAARRLGWSIVRKKARKVRVERRG